MCTLFVVVLLVGFGFVVGFFLVGFFWFGGVFLFCFFRKDCLEVKCTYYCLQWK